MVWEEAVKILLDRVKKEMELVISKEQTLYEAARKLNMDTDRFIRIYNSAFGDQYGNGGKPRTH